MMNRPLSTLHSNDRPNNQSILCIEDDPTIQELYHKILGKECPDYQIHQAVDGSSGWLLANEHIPDIIILDLRLPDQNGLDICKKLKENAATQDIPVIIVSALGDDTKIRVEALQAGADSFVIKPFNRSEFIEIVLGKIREKKAEEKLKKQNVELAEKLAEIESYKKRLLTLNASLAGAEERERKRISAYLHDELGATLALANIRLSSYSSKMNSLQISDLIAETSALLGKAIQDSRVAIYDLSPPILHELGLEAAIKWKMEQVENDGQMKTKLIFRMDPRAISTDLQVFIYRVISEFLINALKHAQASLVLISVKQLSMHIQISVTDNGKGMNWQDLKNNNKKASLGLHHIIERIESIGEKLLIDSRTNEYTQFIVKLPIN